MIRRPWRWYWAGLASTGVFSIGIVVITCCIEVRPMERVVTDIAEFLSRYAGRFVGLFLVLLLLTMPWFLSSLATYDWLRRGAGRDEFHHCLKCGYILKGLSEPRCPECGERI